MCHAVITPASVTMRGKSLEMFGRIGSVIGVMSIQFNEAPPIIAPVPNHMVGLVKSLFEFERL